MSPDKKPNAGHSVYQRLLNHKKIGDVGENATYQTYLGQVLKHGKRFRGLRRLSPLKMALRGGLLR